MNTDVQDGAALEAAARELVDQGKLDAAIETLDRALRLRPDHGPTLRLMIQTLRAARRYQQAAELIRRAVLIEPEHFDHWTNLIQHLLKNNLADEALDAADQARAALDGNEALLQCLAEAFSANGLPKIGLSFAKEAVTRWPDSRDSQFTYARLMRMHVRSADRERKLVAASVASIETRMAAAWRDKRFGRVLHLNRRLCQLRGKPTLKARLWSWIARLFVVETARG